MKAVSRYQLSLIRSISTRDVVYNMINIINNVVCDIVKLFKQVNPKSSYHKKIFFLDFNFYLFEIIDVC